MFFSELSVRDHRDDDEEEEEEVEEKRVGKKHHVTEEGIDLLVALLTLDQSKR